MEQKMYWKDGFYDTPQEGAIEITKKYWQELLDGQSAGLIIVENEKGYPVLKEYKQTLLELKAQKISELQVYDSSESVNSFSIDNVSGWLNKATRVGLMNSISIERESGRSETTIWLNDAKLVLLIEKAIDMLQQIELYALACYHTTQGHIKAINQLETKEEIEAYNFKIGYPRKLSFSG